MREPKKQFYGENNIILLFISHGTTLAPKTWKTLSPMQNETPQWTSVSRGAAPGPQGGGYGYGAGAVSPKTASLKCSASNISC